MRPSADSFLSSTYELDFKDTGYIIQVVVMALDSHGLCSYGLDFKDTGYIILDSYGLYSYGLCSYGPDFKDTGYIIQVEAVTMQAITT